MKNIFIWSWSWSEHKVCAYQSTIVYNFFEKNLYNILKSPTKADFIVLNWYPFEEFEERVNLLTINYYLKKYPSSQILLNMFTQSINLSFLSKIFSNFFSLNFQR